MYRVRRSAAQQDTDVNELNPPICKITNNLLNRRARERAYVHGVVERLLFENRQRTLLEECTLRAGMFLTNQI